MNYRKITTVIAMGIVAALSTAAIAGFQVGNIIAEEEEDKGYTFAEDIAITAIFDFPEGTEVAQFEVITQKSGFDVTETPVIDLEKIVNDDTPLLHKYADLFHQASAGGFVQYQNEFDMEILFAKGGDVIRSFKYDNCQITDSNIETLFDKEEGWNSSKGFAQLDKFEFTCDGYTPAHLSYDAMMKTDQKASTTSTIEYKSLQRATFGQ